MTNGKQSDERAIFLAALELAVPEAREAYLQGAARVIQTSLCRLRELLAAHEASQGPFDAPPPGLGEGGTIDAPRLECPGMQIGPYKLLQQIGEGGMGVVYMAEQYEPVRRKVALKIIKPGMDTRQVIARFEAERQARSLMDHPNIARVLDAGTTEGGRPYFVMELVRGQPITEYCDEHQLTPRQRLEMLLPVCRAIQHAHQKGIIHRDIKPSNILVAEYDQQVVPKVIDFGVAKAVSQPLTERTMFTGLGQVVETLEYMSPEQAKVNQLDIDTRSDVYSLGVLIYELFTGTTPFDKQRLRSAAWDEMLRIIREEEPPKPSTRLSTVEGMARVAARRQTEPGRLSLMLRGELDWIVMKVLDKDRCRRDETANGLGRLAESLFVPLRSRHRDSRAVHRQRQPEPYAPLLCITFLHQAVQGHHSSDGGSLAFPNTPTFCSEPILRRIRPMRRIFLAKNRSRRCTPPLLLPPHQPKAVQVPSRTPVPARRWRCG